MEVKKLEVLKNNKSMKLLMKWSKMWPGVMLVGNPRKLN
jgi:hypothetical protein